jgi:hypothetical protein
VGGDTVTCTVTPWDGTDEGTPVSDSVTIDNSAPSIASISVSPSVAGAEDTLTCSYSGYSDADGDADQSIFAWSVNGAGVGSESTLSGAFVGGDTIACQVTPYDGTDTGSPLSTGLIIDNTSPVVADATISPDPAYTDDTLTCTAGTTTDADGTTSFTYNYDWVVNGSLAATGTTLGDAKHERDDKVVCEVTADDGSITGEPVSSETLTISNTAPEVLAVSLSPSSPTVEDSLTVTATTSDLDGDTVTLTYVWSVDGSDPGTSSQFLEGGTDFIKGQDISVTIAPNDGTDTGSSLSSSTVTVANTPPGQPTLAITPSEPTGGIDDLVCEIDNDAEDIDGDALTYVMSWSVNGTNYTGATTTTWSGDTVLAANTFGGETWECASLPNDGEDDGSPGVATVVLENCTALEFDGSSAYGEVADASDLDLASGNFTVELWFQLASLGTDDVHLLSRRDSTAGWNGWAFGVHGTDSAEGSGVAFFAREETDSLVGTTDLNTGDWVHLAFVHDPTLGEVRLYVNGVEEDATAMSPPTTTTNDLVLGRDSASAALWLDGLLAEVRLSQGVRYSSDFTPDVALATINQSYLHLAADEGTGSTLVDGTGNGNDATLTNTAWVATCNSE